MLETHLCQTLEMLTGFFSLPMLTEVYVLGERKRIQRQKPVPDPTRILRNKSSINLTFFFWTFIFPFKIIENFIYKYLCHSSSSPLPPHMHPNSSNPRPFIFQLYVCRWINKPEVTQYSQVFRVDLSASANLQAASRKEPILLLRVVFNCL